MFKLKRPITLALAAVLLLAAPASSQEQATVADSDAPLTISWKDNYLTIRGDRLPGGKLVVHYLEAYCRPGSTDRDWGQTVIGHRTELVSADAARKRSELVCKLTDGVQVAHTITA